MTTQKLLLVDDDLDLCDLLAQLLEMEGFDVTTAHDGESGLELALTGHYQLLLLDVMMPRLNGLEMLKQLRQHSQVPVLMLTARGEEIDRVIGLEFGADDYLPKPFNDRELIARIKAILRRTQGNNDQPGQLQVGDLQLDPGRQEAHCQGEVLPLTGTEFLLLLELTSHVGQLLDKAHLNQQVLGKKLQAFDRSLDMHLSNLRHKLPAREDGRPRIKTVRGRGYIWLED